MSITEDNIRLIGPGQSVEGRTASLDLPGILPLVLVATTWELLLRRVVGLAAGSVRAEDLRSLLRILETVGTFAESFALLLAFALICYGVIVMITHPTFGPIPHRITVAGFAASLVVIAAVGTLIPLGRDTALLAHAASVLLATLLMLGLVWYDIDRRVQAAAVLLLLPTLLRFYASCSVSIPLLRTDTAVPLHAYRAAEVIAVATAFASPFLIARLSPLRAIRRPPVVAMGLAAIPAFALAGALLSHTEQVREISLLSLGFEMLLAPAQVVYPAALFFFLLAVALLVLPGLGPPRSLSEQRVGYGLALLFVAGLDGLGGTVLAFEVQTGHVPTLVRFLLEGHWEHLDAAHKAMVGPPLRDMYQLVILGLGYVLIAHGALGQARQTTAGRAAAAPREDESS